MLSIGIALYLVLKALEDEIVFFYSPTDILEKKLTEDQYIRVGGLVEKNSIKYKENGMDIEFIISDKKNILKIYYSGILPDLFREGQGIVAEGRLKDFKKIFYAKKILAKHDENYMPPEMKKILENAK